MRELVLSFHHVGPEDQAQVINLGVNDRYPMSHLTSPPFVSFYFFVLVFVRAYRAGLVCFLGSKIRREAL